MMIWNKNSIWNACMFFFLYLSLHFLHSLRYPETIILGTEYLPNVFRSLLLIVQSMLVVADERDSDHFVVMWLGLFVSMCPFRLNAPPFGYYRIHFVVMADLIPLIKKIYSIIIELFYLTQSKITQIFTGTSVTSVRATHRFRVKHLRCFKWSESIWNWSRWPIHRMKPWTIDIHAFGIAWIQLRMCRSHQKLRSFHIVDMRFE